MIEPEQPSNDYLMLVCVIVLVGVIAMVFFNHKQERKRMIGYDSSTQKPVDKRFKW